MQQWRKQLYIAQWNLSAIEARLRAAACNQRQRIIAARSSEWLHRCALQHTAANASVMPKRDQLHSLLPSTPRLRDTQTAPATPSKCLRCIPEPSAAYSGLCESPPGSQNAHADDPQI